MECLEAPRENGCAEGHDGLSAVLREAGASTLHPGTDDGLRGSFGDAGTDGIVATECLRVVHASGLVLVRDVLNRASQLLLSGLELDGRNPRAHRAQDRVRAVVLFL